LVEIDLVSPKAHRLADTQSVAIHHDCEEVVAHAMPASPHRVQQYLHFAPAVRKSFERSCPSAALPLTL
jgi:hypothetical protein